MAEIIRTPSYALAYAVHGYVAADTGEFNPLDIIEFYIRRRTTRDWGNTPACLSLRTNPNVILYAIFGHSDGDLWEWAQAEANLQRLSMDDLYALHDRPAHPKHPVYTNQELANYLSVTNLSLVVDPNNYEPHHANSAWTRLLNGENANGWPLMEQREPEDNPERFPDSYPPDDPRKYGAGTRRRR